MGILLHQIFCAVHIYLSSPFLKKYVISTLNMSKAKNAFFGILNHPNWFATGNVIVEYLLLSRVFK